MKEQELKKFQAAIAALDKLMQPNVEAKFTIEQMRNIRVAKANMNTYLTSLKNFCEEPIEWLDYQNTADYYNSAIEAIEAANKNNSDAGKHLTQQNSPERAVRARNRSMPPPPSFLGVGSQIQKSSTSPFGAEKFKVLLALYTEQQNKAQQQREMALVGEMENLAFSQESLPSDQMKF